ncbi:c-type cytochrome [Propionivibrio sp.]|uniref:c-type cytochrome n=1 Tax=Propionivibrio sp. TaxID=2212460 RepID=UPI003BF3BCFA
MKRLLLAALAALIGSLASGVSVAADEVSIVRGGRLYDDWSQESKERLPSEPHPSFPASIGGVPAADTWRCKECHGWDYKGKHGIVGIRSRHGDDPAAIVAVLKNATHQYNEIIRDKDLLDLANFVTHGQTDMKSVISSAPLSKAATLTYEKYFGTICATCHGLDGSKLRTVSPLGDAARQRPSAVLHVIINGHPGGGMPALSALGTNVAAQMLSFLQTLPKLNLPASIAHGGLLYDDWQFEVGARKQSLPHPAYPKTAFYVNDASLTWRCTACHGWDYQGSQGYYASGRHATGIKGIRDMANADPARVEAVLRNATHQFGAVLKARDLQDLANFVSFGQVDMDSAIDRQSLRMRGNPERGKAYFRSICAGCHTTDGRRMATPPLGRLVRANPWGSLHTILNGHPDEKMPALRELDFQLLIDILAHVQELPDTR